MNGDQKKIKISADYTDYADSGLKRAMPLGEETAEYSNDGDLA
jgi:hypothetical protein